MSRINMDSRGRRPRFFPAAGADEMMSMLLELASEVWTVKERLYVVEKAAAEAGLDLSERIETWRPSDEQAAELEAQRKQMLNSLFRSMEARYVTGSHLREEMDAAAAEEKDIADTLYSPSQAA